MTRSTKAQGTFIPEPARLSWLVRPAIALVDAAARERFVPVRLMAWDPRTVGAWVGGSLHWILPADRTRKALGQEIQNMVMIAAAHAMNSPYCMYDVTDTEPTGLSEEQLEALRTNGDVSAMACFTPRERLAISYARLISATPLVFPDEFIAELTAAFTEREIVILAGLAVEINRNGRLFEALGAQPPGS